MNKQNIDKSPRELGCMTEISIPSYLKVARVKIQRRIRYTKDGISFEYRNNIPKRCHSNSTHMVIMTEEIFEKLITSETYRYNFLEPKDKETLL